MSAARFFKVHAALRHGGGLEFGCRRMPLLLGVDLQSGHRPSSLPYGSKCPNNNSVLGQNRSDHSILGPKAPLFKYLDPPG